MWFSIIPLDEQIKIIKEIQRYGGFGPALTAKLVNLVKIRINVPPKEAKFFLEWWSYFLKNSVTFF